MQALQRKRDELELAEDQIALVMVNELWPISNDFSKMTERRSGTCRAT